MDMGKLVHTYKDTSKKRMCVGHEMKAISQVPLCKYVWSFWTERRAFSKKNPQKTVTYF